MKTIAALAALEFGDPQPPPHGRAGAASLRAAPSVAPPAYALAGRPDPQAAPWRAASLFSGCGGLDLGFLEQGMRADRAYDLDARVVTTYNANLPAAAARCDLGEASPPLGELDVLLAGAPCQGFSTVGKRRLDDPRNSLLGRVGDLALARRPRVIVVENVPAALAGAHGALWRALEDRLRWHGYQVRRLLLKGEALGLAQRRRRLVLLCWLGSDCLTPALPALPALDLGNALAEVEGLAGHDPALLGEGTVNAAIAAHIGPGQKLSNVRVGARNVATWDIPKVFGATSEAERELLLAVVRLRRRDRRRDWGDGDPVSQQALDAKLGRATRGAVESLVERGYLRWAGAEIELKHSYNGKFRRLEWDGVSPTVDTHFGNPAKFLHPLGTRGLTAREALRIQGFPDWFKVEGSRQAVFTMIGNAVPPPMGSALASFVREALLKA